MASDWQCIDRAAAAEWSAEQSAYVRGQTIRHSAGRSSYAHIQLPGYLMHEFSKNSRFEILTKFKLSTHGTWQLGDIGHLIFQMS
jgi:hypothetical protein